MTKNLLIPLTKLQSSWSRPLTGGSLWSDRTNLPYRWSHQHNARGDFLLWLIARFWPGCDRQTDWQVALRCCPRMNPRLCVVMVTTEQNSSPPACLDVSRTLLQYIGHILICLQESSEKPAKRENPHKYLLYKPTFSQLFTFLSASFKVSLCSY